MKPISKVRVFVAFVLISFISPSMFIPSTIATEDWLVGWDYRKEITITGSVGAGTDYSVRVEVPNFSGMQSDFDDVRFTDDDGSTTLDYWRETYTAGAMSVFWVEVADNLDSNQSISLYYGNSTVSTTSSGDDTFLFFDDFEDQDFLEWYTAGAYWSTQGTQVKRGSYAAYGDSGGDAESRKLFADFSDFGDADFMVHMWGRAETENQRTYYFRSTDTSASNVYALWVDNVNDFQYDNGPHNDWELNTAIDDTWIELEIAMDFTNELYKFWRDGVYIDAQDLEDTNGDDVTYTDNLEFYTDSGVGEDMWLDDVYARNWVSQEPIVSSQDWIDYPEAQFIFPVGWDPAFQFGYDAFFIFLGLIMIPASTLYFVRGGKEDMSRDKLFYFLIAFVIGWSLVIGGIMP